MSKKPPHKSIIEKKKKASVDGLLQKLDAAISEAITDRVGEVAIITLESIACRLTTTLADKELLQKTADDIDKFVEDFWNRDKFGSLKDKARTRYLAPRKSKTEWSGNIDNIGPIEIMQVYIAERGPDINLSFYTRLAMVVTCCRLISEDKMSLDEKAKGVRR